MIGATLNSMALCLKSIDMFRGPDARSTVFGIATGKGERRLVMAVISVRMSDDIDIIDIIAIDDLFLFKIPYRGRHHGQYHYPQPGRPAETAPAHTLRRGFYGRVLRGFYGTPTLFRHFVSWFGSTLHSARHQLGSWNFPTG